MAFAKLAEGVPAKFLDLPFRMKGYAFRTGRLGLELEKDQLFCISSAKGVEGVDSHCLELTFVSILGEEDILKAEDE
jgi:hypothetical protein